MSEPYEGTLPGLNWRWPSWLSNVGWWLLTLVYVMLAAAPMIALAAWYTMVPRIEWLYANSDIIAPGDSLFDLVERVQGWVFYAGCLAYPVLSALMVVLSLKYARLWPFVLWLGYHVAFAVLVCQTFFGKLAWYLE